MKEDKRKKWQRREAEKSIIYNSNPHTPTSSLLPHFFSAPVPPLQSSYLPSFLPFFLSSSFLSFFPLPSFLSSFYLSSFLSSSFLSFLLLSIVLSFLHYFFRSLPFSTIHVYLLIFLLLHYPFFPTLLVLISIILLRTIL